MFFNWNLSDPAQWDECIALSEQLYEAQVASVADGAACDGDVRILMLSGPSSSGKTTTALKMRDYLSERGAGADIVSLDNFYKDPSDIPMLPDGTRDLESIASLDVKLLHGCIAELLGTGKTELPKYNFHDGGRQAAGIQLELQPGQKLIFEGIHALNPAILDSIPHKSYRSVFISVGQDFNMPGGAALTRRDTRLLRRLIRDFKFRSAPCSMTLDMWRGVCDGEIKYIAPLAAAADLRIDSAFYYEPCVLRHQALELLRTIGPDSAHYDLASRLTALLERTPEIDEPRVPHKSMLREFLGESYYYQG